MSTNKNNIQSNLSNQVSPVLMKFVPVRKVLSPDRFIVVKISAEQIKFMNELAVN